MIVGMILRHYKTYENNYFIPIMDKINNKYSVYVGENGVGKSSVLEALDVFFNTETASWNTTKGAKKTDAFIAPIFLIKKQKINELLKEFNLDEYIKVFEYISNYFWNISEKLDFIKQQEEYQKFILLTQGLKSTVDKNDYYLLLIGISYEDKKQIYFGGSINNDIIKELDNKFPRIDYNLILDMIKGLYSYIYIPVEASIDNVLKLESDEMQELTDKDILDEIDGVLTEKILEKESRKGYSIVDHINLSLDNFITEINNSIQEIDPSYSYMVAKGYKKNLTPADIRGKILEAYFAIRSLKKGGKEIQELSSGQQRIALIDIASAFLMQKGIKLKNVILAIDEPEASLHVSNCYNQFKRIEELTNNEQVQVLITTHWYGALPTVQNGALHHIGCSDKNKDTIKPVITTYDFKNYFEERRRFPNEDIVLKSYFELTTSIISSIKMNGTNWIICEGSDDKNYLEFYINNKIPKLIILPVAGHGNVTKLFKHLYVPFSEDYNGIKGRVLCLIDSDDERAPLLDFPSKTQNNLLRLCRLQVNKDNTHKLIENDKHQGNYFSTDMEDCLNPKLFYDSIHSVIKKYNHSLLTSFDTFEFNQDAKTSRLKGDNSVLIPKLVDNFNKNKEDIYVFLDNYKIKYKIAEEYVQLGKNYQHQTPQIFEEIIAFFNPVRKQVSHTTSSTRIVEE